MKNKLMEKLELIANKTEGVILSSALVGNELENSTWVKFQKKFPEMFKVIYADKAKIVQCQGSFFRYFYANKIPNKFKSKEDILKEILHSSFVLDGGKDSIRSGDKVSLKGKSYYLDSLTDIRRVENIITFEERRSAFGASTDAYVPKNLLSKWGKRCLQRFFAEDSKNNIKNDSIHLTKEEIESFITSDTEN